MFGSLVGLVCELWVKMLYVGEGLEGWGVDGLLQRLRELGVGRFGWVCVAGGFGRRC